jgi:hypothetical protein
MANSRALRSFARRCSCRPKRYAATPRGRIHAEGTAAWTAVRAQRRGLPFGVGAADAMPSRANDLPADTGTEGRTTRTGGEVGFADVIPWIDPLDRPRRPKG